MTDQTNRPEVPEWQGTRRCFHPGCDEIAPFGVNTRYGVEWFCGGEHWKEAQKRRVSPASTK
ncbi:hypothetical protein C7441_114124 [Pseudaminobacter salicylatoxidans]|uniref:Uncharacterized protein n=1 Tax=Pseudaminobacter salicylatoxidans TaxID=93369 RepID=A0A316BZ46_PSESE|nr:hypothetical protein [Pseudaminobacter salicylatoxidans]PWJ79846.1 hypothetical protein C7441_114124 [Pseudaminobacter salicylatoxidans]